MCFVKRLVILFIVIVFVSLVTACDGDAEFMSDGVDLDRLYDRLFTMNVGNVERDLTDKTPLFGDTVNRQVDGEIADYEERFQHLLNPYSDIVDRLWSSEEYYRYEEDISDKEKLIDFYLFMEYHKDTQVRNLQFPENVQRDLLVIELLFMKRAIDYIDEVPMDDLDYLRDDMVYLYKSLYTEQMLNILYEGKGEMVIMDRLPGIIDRHEGRLRNTGLEDRLKVRLGIPDSVISRGMGMDMVTLYDELGYLPEGDTRRLAILLSLEMRLSGISMRLERFFYVTNSLEGLGFELEEIRRDVNTVNPPDDLKWINDRMLRAIDHLEEIYLFYKGEKQIENIEDIFIDVRTREDFYALSMLSDNIKEVMDKEDFWEEVETIRQMLREGRYEGSVNEDNFGESDVEDLEHLEEYDEIVD